MVAVVRFSRFGGPRVLQIENATVSPPGPGEAWVEQEAIGVITPHIWGSYSLADAATAHADLESGRSSGAIILKP